MKKLRYIEPKPVNAPDIMAFWDWAVSLDDQAVLSLYRPKEVILITMGNKPLSTFFHTDKLEGVNICRLAYKASGPGVLHGAESITAFMSYPFEEKQRLPKRGLPLVIDAVHDLVEEYGIECTSARNERLHHNDLFIRVDGKPKKFFGIVSRVQNQRRLLGFSVTFDFPVDKAREIYRLSTDKFTKKGSVEDIGDIVCGLYDVKPDLDIDEFRGKLAEKIAEKFGWELEASKFTETEQAKLDELAIKLDTREWTEDGVFPTT